VSLACDPLPVGVCQWIQGGVVPAAFFLDVVGEGLVPSRDGDEGEGGDKPRPYVDSGMCRAVT